MCALIGFNQNDPDSKNNNIFFEDLKNQNKSVYTLWSDKDASITLGLTGIQPSSYHAMESVCGRYVLAFNGELYNQLALHNQLTSLGLNVSSQEISDTETLLACISAWGIEKTLLSTVGKFAIAVWDKHEKVLTLARDRLGEKPLYWGWSGDQFVFSSELAAIKAHPQFEAVVNRDALTLLLRHCYIPAPYSIYQGIEKLLPGHIVQIPFQGDLSKSKAALSKPYWSLNQVVEQGVSEPFNGTPEEAANALEAQLKESIAEQSFVDDSLGSFLSGGVDSSVITALLQSQSENPVRTFTLGFNEPGYNEAGHAKAVAKHLGTEHTELYIKPDDALDVIPRLPNIYAEPFADSSQIPTFLAQQLAKQHVSTILSGDGGDELFGGYNRYIAAQKVWGPVQRMPKFVRHMVASGLRTLSPNSWDRLFEFTKPVLPKKLQLSIPGEKARKLSEVLTLSSGEAFYRQLTSHWTDPASVVINAHEPITLLTDLSAWPKTDSLEHSMMAMDAQTYMVDDVLVKVERAAMASGIDVRVPMLDHRVVELAWKMPLNYKIRNGQGKWLLRQVLYRHVPKQLIERPKAGFGIPLASWLRGPLRDWAESLLDERRLQQEGYFYPAPVRAMWLEHLSGKKNWQYHLWNVLMFQAWLETQ